MMQLNEQQMEAVRHINGPQLILAGAGSGKTRVITQRVLHLLQECNVAPWNILAITFTNKAAKEMRMRILAGADNAEAVWIMTFHALCVRILRREIERIGYTRNFSIFDDDDQMRLIKQLMKDHNLSEKYYTARAIKNNISSAKDELVDAQEYLERYAHDFRQQNIAQVFLAYERELKKQNALDFDDLIVKVLELFAGYPDVLTYYSSQFQYVHVDEYQDTNHAQYELVRALASYHGNLCVVGDDDQSIYGWRGADIQNILNFRKDYEDVHVVKLEQNYRSTGNILAAASNVIKNNQNRADKTLWTQQDEGDLITFRNLASEQHEAMFVTDEIQTLCRTHRYKHGDIAILYRTNAQSRVLESHLMRMGIPYRIYGALRFYERAEVKDAMAYLRVMANPLDEISLLRILNKPARGIGQAAQDELMALARAQNDSVMGVILDVDLHAQLSARVQKRIAELCEVFTRLLALRDALPLAEYAEMVLTDVGLIALYAQKEDSESQERLENIREFLGAVSEFATASPESGLEEFLSQSALISDIDGLSEQVQSVTLLTVHSAKGLEFPVVFLVGMEEGLFPSSRSMEEEDSVEEERRLCYVGITRAREKLYLVSVVRRVLFNREITALPSRFISEIPTDILQGTAPVRKRYAPTPPPAMQAPRPAQNPAQGRETQLLSTGDKVMHDAFGKGTVIATSAMGGNKQLLTVAFEQNGIKRLVSDIAPIRKL